MAATTIAVASLALTAGSKIVQGVGQSRALNAQAAQAERAGEIARIQANQISTDMQTELRSNLARIRAIRASTGGQASPSEIAILGAETEAGDRARRIRVTGTRMQATQYDTDAGTYRSAARFALFGAAVNAASSAASGYSSMNPVTP